MYRSLFRGDFRRLYTSWNPGKVVCDRKSEFQGRYIEITRESDVEKYLDQFKQDHKRLLKSASHPYIYAWRLGDKHTQEANDTQTSRPGDVTSPQLRKQLKKAPKLITRYVNIREGSYDCGEKMGGSELMRRVLHRYDLYNVLVIVTRWMYGLAIGPKRFQHIGAAGTDSLKQGGFIK